MIHVECTGKSLPILSKTSKKHVHQETYWPSNLDVADCPIQLQNYKEC